MSGARAPVALDPVDLRRVFGTHPSGVTAIAAQVDGTPIGMVASSFTSVSLDPPLVSVCVAHTSTTWPRLRRAPRLGVSILSAGQERAGRQLAAKAVDRFAGLASRVTAHGAVLLDGAGGWLEVSVADEIRAGDHDIVLLAVHDLGVDHDARPLVFHASRFTALRP